jgi:hypothetical protein
VIRPTQLLLDLLTKDDCEPPPLATCWLFDDIETSLPERIEREIRDIEWERCAVDDNF